jgi:purine-binding chemotaxis protein CheW
VVAEPEVESRLDLLLEQEDSASDGVVAVDEPQVKLVLFDVAGRRFAMRGANVSEILPPGEVFFVPGTPSAMVGVINLRGQIESVIALDQLLGLTGNGDYRGWSIMLAHGGVMRSGLLVEQVVDLVDLAESAIQPPIEGLPAPFDQWLEGEIGWAGEAIPCLNAERMLSDYRATHPVEAAEV